MVHAVGAGADGHRTADRDPGLFAAPDVAAGSGHGHPGRAAEQVGGRMPFELRHVDALDGLRGAAVAGVLLYHGDALTGGYLGVDLFFVLSGFLITALLLRDVDRHGRVPLRPFWERRARRLLPALAGFLVGIAVFAVVWGQPGQGPDIRAEALATVAYVANWWSLVGGSGYWEAFQAPSPLRHTWSLAIEEQFYLAWPLLVAGVGALALRRRWRPAVPVAVVAGVGAVASYAWMALSLRPGEDPSRQYFGTDTRAGAILVGAGLAAVLTARGWRRRAPAGAAAPVGGGHAESPPSPSWRSGATVGRWALEAVAVLALLTLAAAWYRLDGRSPKLYRGGFVVAGLSVVVLIAAVVHPVSGPVARVLAVRPLRALGLISYGLYLWHWPVYVVLQTERLSLGLDGLPLLALKIAVSLALAVASYVVIERPIRLHGLRAWGRWGPALLPAAGVASILAVVAVTAIPGVVPPAPVEAAAPTPLDDVPVAPPGAPPPLRPDTPTGDGPLSGPVPRPADRPPRVMVVGDSVGFDVGMGLEADADELGILAVNRAIPACTLGRANSEWRNGEQPTEAEHPRCRNWEQTWGETVERFRPDAVVFTFAGPPPDDLRLDGRWQPVCSPEVARYWRGEVEAAVSVLAAHGATVYLTAPAPHRSPFFGDEENARLDCLREVYEGVAASERSRTRWLRMDDWVCPEGRCVEEVDGVVLRHDGVHFIEDGRRILSRWIVDQVFGPPSG